MDFKDHKVWLILGIVVLAVGVLFLVPFVSKGFEGVGKASAGPVNFPNDYIARWSFDDTVTDEEGREVEYKTRDLSGVINGVPSYSLGVSGKSLNFAGNNYLSLNLPPSSNNPFLSKDQFTVSFWMYPREIDRAQYLVDLIYYQSENDPNIFVHKYTFGLSGSDRTKNNITFVLNDNPTDVDYILSTPTPGKYPYLNCYYGYIDDPGLDSDKDGDDDLLNDDCLKFDTTLLPGRKGEYSWIQGHPDYKKDEWKHVVFVYGDSKLKIYIDGSIADELTIFPAYEGYSSLKRSLLLIGSTSENPTAIPPTPSFNGGHYFKGLLDELLFYNRALSSTEVETLYTQKAPCFNQFSCGEEGVAAVSALKELTDPDSNLNKLRTTYFSESSADLCPVYSPATARAEFDLSTNNPRCLAYYPIKEQTTTMAPKIITNFAHKGISYEVRLLGYNKFDGRAKLDVQKKFGGGTPILLPDLLITEDHPLQLGPQQKDLNLDSDTEPEAYLQAVGYYNKAGELGLMIVVTPAVDLNLLGSGKSTLLGDFSQNFYADRVTHTLGFEGIPVGTEVVYNAYVDGSRKTAQASGWPWKFEHFFNEANTLGVTSEVAVQPSASALSAELPRFLTFELTRFPPDLTNLYEVTFTNTSTSSFTSSFGGTSTISLKVCSFDVQDVNVVTVCDALSGKKLFALEAAKPKRTKAIIDDVNLRTDLTDAARTEILGRIGGLDTNLLFLYNKQVGTTPKMVHVYRLDDLTPGTAPAGPQTKEGTMFSNNLVSGRSYGFMVQDEGVEEYYLLSHPPRPFDDLNDLTITALSNPKLPRPLPQADDERAIFILPAERFADVTGQDKRLIRFTVKRIQTPDAQYEVSADTDFDNKVDLAEQLETAIDTYGSVELTTVDDLLGEITLSPDDDALAKEEMVIKINSREKRLVLAEPQVDGQTLFYYNTFYENKDEERKQTYHTKQAEIFKLYQLGASGSYQIQTHPITDEAFYIPLLRGRRLALSADGNYYLLKHNERWKSDDKLTFFKREAMTLTLLGETEKDIEGKYSKTTQEVTFNLEKAGKTGQIILHFNTEDLNNQQAEFYFVPKSEEIITEFDPVKEYRAELPARTSPIVSKLQLKEVMYNDDGTVTTIPGNEYRNCDEPDIDAGITNFMLFCTEEGGEETTEELTTSDFLEVENTVVTYRGKVGGKKQVVFQYVLGDGVDLSQNGAEIIDISWRELTTNNIAKKNPAIKIGDRYFELDGSSFSALTFRNISAAKESFPVSVLSTVEGANTGRIAIGTNLYKLEQSLVDYKITLRISKESSQLLGPSGITVAEGESVEFISSINKEEVYTLSASRDGSFVRVAITDLNNGNIIYSLKIPERARRQILLSNDNLINVEILTDTDGNLIAKITK